MLRSAHKQTSMQITSHQWPKMMWVTPRRREPITSPKEVSYSALFWCTNMIVPLWGWGVMLYVTLYNRLLYSYIRSMSVMGYYVNYYVN